MRYGILLLAAAAALAADKPGTRPLMAAADYPSHAESGGLSIGAILLSPEKVRDAFTTDLNRGYVVVEVALYPPDGSKLDVGPGDFVLRLAGTDTSARAAAPKAVAAALQKAAAGDREIALYPQVGAVYGGGPRGGGWGTSTGVGVGVGTGRQGPAASDADRRTMAAELGDQELPETVATGPVSGYLYFPALTKRKDAAYELEYQGSTVRLVLPLEAARPK
jgi:hypothetical protein